jgi:hypothetical protein
MALGDRFFFQLPSSVISTVDHPLGSLSLTYDWGVLAGVLFSALALQLLLPLPAVSRGDFAFGHYGPAAHHSEASVTTDVV